MFSRCAGGFEQGWESRRALLRVHSASNSPARNPGWRSHEHERCLVHVKGILAQHFRAQLILKDNKCIKVALDKDSRSVCRLRAQTQPVHDPEG